MTKTIKKKRKGTAKQKKLLHIFSENIGMKGFTKSMYQMMIEAGYSETSAKQQTTLLAGIQKELEIIDPLANIMGELRNKAIKVLKESKDKFEKASLKDLIDSIDKLTKNIQLVSGKPTENIAMASLSKIEQDTKVIIDALSK